MTEDELILTTSTIDAQLERVSSEPAKIGAVAENAGMTIPTMVASWRAHLDLLYRMLPKGDGLLSTRPYGGEIESELVADKDRATIGYRVRHVGPSLHEQIPPAGQCRCGWLNMPGCPDFGKGWVVHMAIHPEPDIPARGRLRAEYSDGGKDTVIFGMVTHGGLCRII